MPLQQLTTFIQSAQDANISLERLSDIHNKPDEDVGQDLIESDVNEDFDIQFRNVSFRYTRSTPLVLKNLNFTIPQKKITAIVGMSGSGKTTLLKLLLKFYVPETGEILIGESNIKNISGSEWRKQCGVVMQEGYLFSDTILNNITISSERPDIRKFNDAIQMANIRGFVEELPQGQNTLLGEQGVGLSMGQKQRIMIARAIYKDPKFIFLDEATSSLDATNEKEISDNIKKFSKGRTILIIAHRLSTVKRADQVILLENGKIAEIGTHDQLIKRQGKYFQLVQNQL